MISTIYSISENKTIVNLPYTALRAFEAAADELGVSQSAVSQHVGTLDEWLAY